MKHYHEKIQGWFDYENIYHFVVRLFPTCSKFLEVGVYKGRASAYLATEIINSGKDISLTCVDIFEPEKIMALGGDSYSHIEFINNMEPVMEGVNLRVMKYESTKAAETFIDESLDFIFIDAGHTFEEVLADITAWLPKVKQGGIIGGHDFSTNWPGIEMAVRETFGNDFTKVGNSWIHVKKSQSVSLSEFNVLVTVLNYEREKHISTELEKFNIKWQKIQCILVAEIHKGNVWMANAMSFIKAFNAHKLSGSELPLLVLEDDIKLIANPNETIKNALAELPEDWDLLYLGAHLKTDCIPYSKTLDRVTWAWCTHSVAYSENAIQYILERFNPMTDGAFDEWLRKQPLNSFITRPMLITQKQGFSYIQNCEVNYECIFESQIHQL